MAVVGHEGVTIDNVYNKGNIIFNSNCSNTHIGGICGLHDNYQDIENSYLRNAYNIGDIDGMATGTLYVGSILGASKPTTVIENCYYLQNLQYEGIGQNDSVNSEISEFAEYDKESLVEKLNGISNTWKHDAENINNGYPILSWQCEQTMNN